MLHNKKLEIHVEKSRQIKTHSEKSEVLQNFKTQYERRKRKVIAGQTVCSRLAW